MPNKHRQVYEVSDNSDAGDDRSNNYRGVSEPVRGEG